MVRLIVNSSTGRSIFPASQDAVFSPGANLLSLLVDDRRKDARTSEKPIFTLSFLEDLWIFPHKFFHRTIKRKVPRLLTLYICKNRAKSFTLLIFPILSNTYPEYTIYASSHSGRFVRLYRIILSGNGENHHLFIQF